MAYMRNHNTGTIIGPMTDDSPEYRYLQSLRDSGTPHPTWEEVGVEDAEAAGAIVDGKVASTVQAMMPAVAAGADETLVVGKAPFTGSIASVVYYPAAAIVGADTNSRTFNVIEGGAGGAGNTNIGSVAMTNGVNATAEEPLNIPVTTPAVNSGDEIELQSQHVGTGIADPGGLVVVTFTRE